MDPFELLKADHRKVEALFDRLEKASGKRKLNVFAEIKSELELHTHIEETILYPALEKPQDTHDLTLEAYEEHDVVKKLLAQLSDNQSADEEWQAKAKVLRENVEHHVEEEEGELFDKADDALEDEELEELGDRLAAEKARKLGQPVPKRTSGKAAKRSKKQPGVIARLANFVGLGGGSSKKKTTGAKKSAKGGSKKSAKKSSAGKAAKKSSSKTSKKSATKRTSSSSKKAAKKSNKSGAKKRGGRR